MNIAYKVEELELSRLISFFHVARLSSISKASEVVCRNQPAVTQQIKALEDEIGCKLFHRIGKRKLVPTQEGKRLQAFVRSLMYEMDCTLDDIRLMGGGEYGQVSIAAPFTTCFQILPAVIKRFNDSFPKVNVSIFDQPQDAAVAMVRDGEADFAIASESVIPRGVHTVLWKRVVPALIVPAGHLFTNRNKITIRDIAGEKLILPPDGRRHPGRLLLEKSAREAGILLDILIESSNVELSSRLVEEGLGVSFATIVEGASLLHGRELDFVPLDHLLPDGNLWIAMRDEDVLRGARAKFLEALMAI